MNSSIYISELVEIAKRDIQRLRDLSPKLVNIANHHDVSTTVLEEIDNYVVLFTYNSPKILDVDEMDYLDLRFDRATNELRTLLNSENVPLINSLQNN